MANRNDDADVATRLLSAKRILIKGGLVVTLDKAVGDFERADVLIVDGKIQEVRPDLSVSSGDIAVVDAAGRIVLPGFVDTHCHSYQGLLRGLLPNGLVLPDYDRDIQKNITAHYGADDAYAGVLITSLAMLNMGTTTMVDISQVAHSPEHIEAALQALRDAGMRAVFAYSRGTGPAARHPEDIFRLLPKHFNSEDQLLTPALAVSTAPETFKVARRAGVRAVLHIRLNPGPLIELGRAGLLKEGDEFIHCTHLSGDAWRLIKDVGGRTSHSPPLEMAMGHGAPSMQDAMDAGLRPSLSCDHCSTVGQDMFGIMRTTFGLQRLSALQRRRNGDAAAPDPISCRQVLEFATIEGARCAGLERKIGSLTRGKEADLILLRADDVDVCPLNNAASAVVNLMNPSHVEAVFVRGQVKKWRGRLLGHDMNKVLTSVRKARDGVLQRAGFKIDLLA